MDSEEDKYNLRSRQSSRKRTRSSKNSRKSVKKPIGRNKRRKKGSDNVVHFTRDGYVQDGFAVDDPSYDEGENHSQRYFELDSKPVQDDIINHMVETGNMDSKVAESIVRNAFKGTGEHLVQSYVGCKPLDEEWKLGLPKSTIKSIEPQLKCIREMIKEETPTIPKIFQANITKADKMRCTKLYDQLQNIEPFTTQYDKKVEEINNILRKGKRYTKAEIKRLEKIEASLRVVAAPPDNLKNQILNLDAPEHIQGVIYGQYLEMLEHEPGSQAYNSIREEIEWSVRLPHNRSHDYVDLSNMTRTELNQYYAKFLESMDEELYGMNNIKMKMLHIINDRGTSGNTCGRNIAIVGAPGTGKTAIGKAMAKVMGVPFEKISVGGMEDASILKGSDRVWNSASPSIVLQILSRMKSSSGVVMFDEVDKLGETPKGREVMYSLLNISDYVHNKEFRDNYLNKYPHDFSKILFIFCMNRIDTLDSAFLNRLDVIETQPYSTEEKMVITQEYVLPRALSGVGINSEAVTINPKAANKLVLATRNDPGVRTIEKAIKSLVGKINMYHSILLEDGTTGNIDLGYTIPNFKFPIVITPKLLVALTKDIVTY